MSYDSKLKPPVIGSNVPLVRVRLSRIEQRSVRAPEIMAHVCVGGVQKPTGSIRKGFKVNEVIGVGPV